MADVEDEAETKEAATNAAKMTLPKKMDERDTPWFNGSVLLAVNVLDTTAHLRNQHPDDDGLVQGSKAARSSVKSKVRAAKRDWLLAMARASGRGQLCSSCPPSHFLVGS